MNIDLDRHILNIVQNNEIKEQSDLQKMLKEMGQDVPQASLSRRLKKLKIAKISGVYKATEFISTNMSNIPMVLNIQVSEFGLIVLHTYPGNANSLAFFIDQKYVNYSQDNKKNLSILGTIAGDDTVLLIIKNKAGLDMVLDSLYKDFPYINRN